MDQVYFLRGDRISAENLKSRRNQLWELMGCGILGGVNAWYQGVGLMGVQGVRGTEYKRI